MLTPNYKRVPAFKDIRVRQAMNYALDRNALNKTFGAGYATATSAFPTFDALDDKVRNYYPYNRPRRSNSSLPAGYAKGLNLTMLTYGPWGSVGTPLIEAAAKYFAAVGINVTVQHRPASPTGRANTTTSTSRRRPSGST